MASRLLAVFDWSFAPEPPASPGHLGPRWLFLRALGLIYFSAFYSLAFQIRGLIGPNGILPAGSYLEAVDSYFHDIARFWYAPTLLWFASGNRAVELICWTGLAASLLAVFNIWPRLSLLTCFLSYLSFVSAAQDFSGYQSDGMLLEAGFIALFLAPWGLRPGLGRAAPPSRASTFLLQWEWFRIYFESGAAKLLSGDRDWRHLTAMDQYYQNGPLPTWIGWYLQQLPHRFHGATAFATLALELAIVWMLFLPRRFRIICFWIVTPWEIAVILTANYTFLNYLVLSLGILLLDDKFLDWCLPARWKYLQPVPALPAPASGARAWLERWRHRTAFARRIIAAFWLTWIFYATTAQMIWAFAPGAPLPRSPVTALDPSRIANRYGLFAVMTPNRYEIEFQGSSDGLTWKTYPFRYKPQALNEAPRIYAPYQPRLDWNLWFASLGSWRENSFVLRTEERLLENSPEVLALFAGNPFPGRPPAQVRAAIWQYWFTDIKTKRETGLWWRRESLGLYAPALERTADGRFTIVELPGEDERFP
ncbi:MAG: lipase maturation factor family protein [Candidatus Acidiferrales bacterium]